MSINSCYALYSNQSQIKLSKIHADYKLLALVHENEIVIYHNSELLAKINKI